MRMQNEREALLSFYRDREAKDSLVFRQIEERQSLYKKIRDNKVKHGIAVARLHREIATVRCERSPQFIGLTQKFNQAGQSPHREQDRDIDFEL